MYIRFVRCKNWLQFLKGKSSEFIQSLGVPKATALKEYKNEDFAEDAPVTDMDFQFAQLMLQDDHVQINSVYLVYRHGSS